MGTGAHRRMTGNRRRDDEDTADGCFRDHGTFTFVKEGDRWWIAAAHSTNVVDGSGITEPGCGEPGTVPAA